MTEEDAVLWMKGVVEELVRRLHVGRVEFTPAEHPAFTPGAALTVKVNGRDVGILGAVSAKLRHPYRLSTQMALCEVELKPFLKNVGATGRVSPVPQFPLVRRDVAIVASQGVKNADIENVIRKNGGKILTKVTLFDIFKPKGAAEAARSLAYSLEFRSPEKTLTDEEVGQAFRRVVDALKATGGIEVRES